MSICGKVGAAAVLLRSVQPKLKGSFALFSTYAPSNASITHISAAQSRPQSMCPSPLFAAMRRMHVASSAVLHIPAGGNSGGRQGRTGGQGGSWDATMWKVMVTGTAGLVLAAQQGTAEARCEEEPPKKEDMLIAKMCTNKDQGSQSSLMANIEHYGTYVAPVFNAVFTVIDFIAPVVIKVFQVGQAIYSYLPVTMIEALGGLVMCFFGGLYPLTIAAFETLVESGGDVALKHLFSVWQELVLVYQANAADNKKDDDNDGVADVKQISAKELVTRKMALFLKTVDPSKLLDAYAGIAASLGAVVVVLKIQFAKVIALSRSISTAMKPVMSFIMGPILVALIPKDYHKWVAPLIQVFCQFIAQSIAWFLYSIVVAVHSGIRGGLICTRALIRWLNDRKLLTWKHEETMLDEYLGWMLAAAGIYWQLKNWMTVPFPLNVLLFPLSILEEYLRW
jgi:hypothetical protein